MQHSTITAAGASFHVVTVGSGPALLLLHGWPEYWRTWDLVMERLQDRFTPVATDLRGFGASDMLALLDAMGRARPAVPVRLDRPAVEDLHRP